MKELNLKLNIQQFAGSTFEFGASGYLQGRIVWSSTSNGSVANSSNVTATLQARRTNSYTTTGTWTGDLNIDGDNRGWSWHGSISNSWVSVYSFTKTVGHNNDGTKSCYIGGSVKGPSGTSLSGNTSSGSQTVGLDTIDRFAVTNSVSGSDIESSFSVNYTKYSNSFSYKLRISIPNVVMLERIDYNTSGASFSLSQTTIDYLLNRYNTTNNVPLGFAIETYSGGTKLSDGNEVIITGKIVNANPVFTDFEYEDINATTLALTGDSSINVNGYSTIKATISTTNKATAIKSATMSKYRFIIGDTSSDVSYSDDSTVEITIPNAKNGTYNMYAIDSRNNSTLVTKLASNELNYTSITLNASNLSATRDSSGVGTNCNLHFEGTFWNNSFGLENNSITSVSYRFKKTSSSTWEIGPTTITPTITDDTFSFTGTIGTNNQGYSWDLGDSYNIEITINDELSTITKEVILMSAVPTLSLSKNGVGIMGKYDDNVGGLLQVGGQRYDNQKIIKYEVANSTKNYEITGLNINENNLTRITIIPAYNSSTKEDLKLRVNGLTNYEVSKTRLYANGSATSQTVINSVADYIYGNYDEIEVGTLLSFSYIKLELFIENGKLAISTHEARQQSGNQRNLFGIANTNKTISTITSLNFITNNNSIPVGTKIIIEII